MTLFHSARLRLTLWYVLGIICISTLFSIALYNTLESEIERLATLRQMEIQDQLHAQHVFIPLDQLYDISGDEFTFVQEARSHLILNLLIANGLILLLSAGIGYALAGKTLKPIQDMMDEQNRFISDASHELKTPLTALKSAAEVYLRDKKRTQRDADILIKESITDIDRLSKLSESLLTLAHYQTRPDALCVPVALHEVIENAVRTMQPIAQKKHMLIQTHTQEGMMMGDRETLTQLWIILLDNAIKYSAGKTTVTVSLSTHDGSLVCSIADQGMGMRKEDMDHIFDRFYRADASRETCTGGHGLGLSIAKKIVDTHKGTIRVRSTLGQGSLFTIIFPKLTPKA